MVIYFLFTVDKCKKFLIDDPKRLGSKMRAW